jgi:hypothetical protein
MRNKAKQSEKDAKQNSKLARLSETKENKVRMTQFRLHEPLKTILNQKETCEKRAHFLHVSFWFRMVLRGSYKQFMGFLHTFCAIFLKIRIFYEQH